jgi:phosphatidylserine decarboxylase
MKLNSKPSLPLTNRAGNWLPSDPDLLNQWLQDIITEVENNPKPLAPVMVTFKTMIETNPVMLIGFTEMFYAGANPPPVVQKDSGDKVISTYQEMLTIINHVLTTAPEFNTTGMVGFPINAILDYSMITLSGLTIFSNSKVNAMFREVLRVWAEFLDSPDSRYVLNTGETGWLSPAAIKALSMNEFQWDPQAPYGGFKSWNDFFIREFKEGQRCVACPDDDKVIVSACESAPYNNYLNNAKRFDTFWIKSQPYSLENLLAGNYVDYFVGGSVYQAYLSAENYHRWHSPINGTVVKSVQVPGTYYSETIAEGFDPAGPNNSQGYIAHVATRALIFIESPDPVIGMICVVPIGMAEVSSCVVTVKAGQKVKKGEQIGYFQFGGSTHCVLFKKDAIKEWAPQAIADPPQNTNSPNVKVNSWIASAN